MAFVLQRLLCLVDLSQASTAVLSWTRLLAEAYRANVEVLHCSWIPKIEAEARDISFEVLGTEIEGRVNAIADAALGKKVKYQSRIVEGHPVKMILQYMAQYPPDIVVLGSHGYDGYVRTILGSVAENLLHAAPCPILIVKGAPLPGDVHSLRTILCATDFSDASRHCVLAAGDLAELVEAELHVAYVAPADTPVEQLRSALASWIPDVVWACGRVRDVVLHGDAAETIVGYARSIQADLAIVAAEMRPFLEFSTLGRTTERVVRFCACSVLAIPKRTSKSEYAVEPAHA